MKVHSFVYLAALLLITCYLLRTPTVHADTEGEPAPAQSEPAAPAPPASQADQSPAAPANLSPNQPSGSTASTDSTGPVTAPDFNADSRGVDLFVQSQVPPELYETPTPNPLITPTPSPNPVHIGVKMDFLGNVACALIGRFFSGFCPKDMELVTNQPDSNESLPKKTAVLIQTQRPDEVQPTPLPFDPNLRDNPGDSNGNVTGNQKIDAVSTSLGGDTGFYTADRPDFGDLDCSQMDSWLTTQKIDDFQNLILRDSKKKFNQDCRPKDIRIRREIFERTSYPDDIRPLSKPFIPTPTPPQ